MIGQTRLRNAQLVVMRRQGLLGIGEQFFVELLARTQASVFDADLGFARAREADHVAREIRDLHRLPHVEHENLATLAHRRRLQHQLQLSEQQISNAVKKYEEAPIGLKAASDAFLQKSTLYENGLSNIADLAQALYNINRAETDRDIAYNGVWQAILYKSATVGDLGLFLSQVE